MTSEKAEMPHARQNVNALMMSRDEQYDWLMFLLRANDKEIVEHIKENPRKAIAVMRFDVFGTCNCSQDVEKGFIDSDNGKDSKLLLQRCVRYGLCPHILLLRHGYSEDNPLFYTDELFEQLYSNKELDLTERPTPNYGGLYWIHVAIITGKFDAVAELLHLIKINELIKHVNTLDLKLNPLHLALLHDGVSLIDPLMQHFPEFLLESVKLQNSGQPIYIPEFLVLQKKKLTSFNIILPFFPKVRGKKVRRVGTGTMLYSALNASVYNMNYDCFSSLLSLSKFKLRSYMEDDLIRRVLQTRDDKMVKILCESVPKSSTFVKELICMVIEKDNSDLCNALMTSMLKSDKYVIEDVTQDDRILWYAILGRNPQITSLLINNNIGVTPNLKNKRNIDLLKWAKILKLPAIYEMLIAAGCEPLLTDQHHYRPSCVFKEVVESRIRTHAMENIKVLVEESGFDPNGEDDNSRLPPVYSAFRARKFDIVKYLIMKGASLKINKATESMFHRDLCCKKLGEMFYQYWCQLTMILIDTNAQFLVHFNKAVLFDIINYNVVLLDIFYRLSHTIPLSIQQNLEEYHATCDKPKPASSVNGGDQNQLRHEIIEALLYKPRSLQLACRNAFRRQFGSNVSAVISSLGDDVPRRVIEFLNFDDVISDLEEHLKYEK